MPTRCGSKAWDRISPASWTAGTRSAWIACCCWPRLRSARATRVVVISRSRPTAAFAAAASRKWCRSCSRACRSPIRVCSTTVRRGRFRSIGCGAARLARDAPGACAWRGCGCTWARPRRWRWRNSASTMPPADRDGPPLSRQARQRIWSVPHGTPFLEALAAALLAGNLPAPGGRPPGPLELSQATLLLPTRRDIKALQQAFLKAANGAALLLPRLKLISHTGEALTAVLAAIDGQDAGGQGQPAIGKLERDLALSRLVLGWSQALARAQGGGGARTPAQAVRQAKELGRLLDLVDMEEVDLGRLALLVPDDFAAHWGLTLEFLKIVTERWPQHLMEVVKVSPADWRKALMRAEAGRLRSAPPVAPVIVAGVTGTVPAATELMRAVLELDNGALVLPALDQRLDAASWSTIGPAHAEHPQFGLKTLLDALGVDRQEVARLPGCAVTPAQAARFTLISEAMRPAATTERWHSFLESAEPQQLAKAFTGVSLIEAASAADEAEAIALILREAAEHPGKTAALVTPDRALARRVSVRLKTWDLDVPDQAGRPLASSEVGVFIDRLLHAG